MGEVEEQPSPTGMLGWLGFGLGVFSIACLGISFASPYWFQTYPGSFNAFKNMGLWEVCFDNYMHHSDFTQEIYDGCWWVFNTDAKYWKLREWLLPPWFISVQVMVTASLLIELGAVIAAALLFLHFCPIMNHEYHQTYAMFACAALQFLATMVMTIAVAVYGSMCGDRQWMPRPDLNFMSWGYGFAIIYGMFALASGVCFFLEARKAFDELMRRDEEYTRAVLEMSHATFPMGGASYGAPSYAPSYPDYQSQPSYSDEKKPPPPQQPSYSTQPSYGGQSGYGGYGSEKAGGYAPEPGHQPQQQVGYAPEQGYQPQQQQAGYAQQQQPQQGYAGGSQSGYGYGDTSQQGYGQQSYGAQA